MSEILTKLSEAKEKQQLIEIHHFISPDTYTVGYVISFDKAFCLVKSLDPDGKINGILLINILDIYDVIFDDDYLKTILIKEKLAKEKRYYDLLNVEKKIVEIDLHHPDFLAKFLKTAFINKEIITIGFVDDADLDAMVTGIVTKLDDLNVTVNYIDDYDLSSLWTLSCTIEQINYLRLNSFQTNEHEALFNAFFSDIF